MSKGEHSTDIWETEGAVTDESETSMTMEFETTPAAGTAGRWRPSRRVVAGLGAAMLVAAAGGIGFGIGRNVDRPDQVDTAADADEALSPAATTAVEQPAPTDVATNDAVPAATDAPAETLPAAGDVAADVALDEAASAGAIRSSGSAGYSMFGNEPMELLFERTTETGLDIRAQLGALWPTEEFGYFEDGWQPPGWCFQTGEVRLAMTGAGIIDVGSVGWFSEPFQGRAASWLTLGRVDGSPHRVVFTQVPEGTSLVTATFGDGAVDSTTPQNGVAILVAPGEPETILHDHDQEYGGWIEELPDFTITFEGAATGDATVAHDEIGTWNDPEYAASCSPPPPALPDAGEQPADPAAAEAEIVAAMSQLYGSQADSDGALDLLDDATGVAEAREQVRSAGYATEASNADAIVEELVFTTPTEAWFRYRVETGGIGLNERYGIAVQIDGAWLITRATICQDLSMAGGSCGDSVTRTIRPPGYEYVEEAYLE